MNLGLDLSMRPEQKLSFQMIQSLKLLQVNTLQLEQILKSELETNPVLELAESDAEQEIEEENASDREEESSPPNDEPSEAEAKELEINEEAVDWEAYLDEGFDLGGRMSEEREQADEDRFERTPVYQESLSEYLEKQLSEKKISGRMLLLVRFVIGSLDPDGYLRVSLDEIADFTNTTVAEVEQALSIVWSMEPAGVGARTLQECLMLQLRARNLSDSLAARIVSQAWDLFEKLRIPDIARTLNVDVKEIQAAIDLIKTLNPRPGYSVDGEQPSSIVPDLIVEKVDGDFVVMLNDRSVPQLRINKEYVRMIRRGSTARQEVKKYIRDKLNGATWLIRSIEQRKATMLKVMNAIVEKQRQFFEHGPPHLNPLKLQDIADMIGMHISTISRVTSNKYVQTPFGVYELKYFFTEALGQDANGSDVSVEKIKSRIRDLIAEEDQARPLSDQLIAEILAGEGYKVARRTVAKYREQLKILPARLRQTFSR